MVDLLDSQNVALRDAEAGREAARQLVYHWEDRCEVQERFTDEFAEAAIRELVELQREHGKTMFGAAAKHAAEGAEQLNVESFHGIVEVIQNADDVAANAVNLAFKRHGGYMTLLVSHDGTRVRLPDVPAMALAYLSTKEDDPHAKGKFGIGLKTLGRLSSRLSVHSPPYHFAVEEAALAQAKPAPVIPGIYSARDGETLLELRLLPEFDLGEFTSWLRERGASWLLFLDTVRQVRLVNLKTGKPLVEHRLRTVKRDEVRLSLKTGTVVGQRTLLREGTSRRSWSRYSVEIPVSEKMRRKYKATASTTPIGVAISSDSNQAPLYTGLPLEMSSAIPFAINGQFDPDTARRNLLKEPWNEWLFDRISDLVGAVALSRFEEMPKNGWAAIPLRSENLTHEDDWLHELVNRMIDVVHDRMRASLRFPVDGANRRLRNLVYEAAPLEGLLEISDVETLAPKLYPVPTEIRDTNGRWRAILEELGETKRLEVHDALEIFDWDDELLGSRTGQWFVRMINAALEADDEAALYDARCLQTRDGIRFAPSDVGSSILLLTRQVDDLAYRLGVSAPIASAFMARNATAQRVRDWLGVDPLSLTP
jgi:hypothetical protein